MSSEQNTLKSGNNIPRPRPRPKTPVHTVSDDEDLQVLSVKHPPQRPRSRIETVDLTEESPQPTHSKLKVMEIATPVDPTKRIPIKCSICLDSMSHPVSTVCGHLFCESCLRLAVRQHGACPTCRKKLTMRQFHQSIASIDWIEQLDLRRAYNRLQAASDFSVPWPTTASKLFDVLAQPDMHEAIRPFEERYLEEALKMHAGPIPGLDASRLLGIQSEKKSPEFAATAKKRTLSEDKSRSASPASERSANASPTGSTKKPRSHSIVRTTYHSAR